MEMLHSILLAIRRHNYLASLGLQEAYFHMLFLPACHQFLRFCYQGDHYQYCALSFELSSAPKVFTEVLIAPLLARCITAFLYLDEIFLRVRSLEQGALHLQQTIQCLKYHGFLMNMNHVALCQAIEQSKGEHQPSGAEPSWAWRRSDNRSGPGMP